MIIVKSFALFKKIGANPTVVILSLIEYPRGQKSYYLSPHDNRFFDKTEDPDNVNFETIESKAKSFGYVEVPVEIANILKGGNYWGNYTKIKPYCPNQDFLNAVETSAGNELPELN